MPEQSATYRYVADGRLTHGPIRQRVRLFRHPLLLLGFVAIGQALGLTTSFATYSDSVSEYLGRIVVIGIVWGLYWIVFTALAIGLLLGLMVWLERRRLRRLFPAGSTTEVTVTDDGVVLAGPTGTRTLSYDRMTLVKPVGDFLVLCRRSMRSELVPGGVLPEDAVAYVSARALGVWPASDQPAPGVNARTFVVPEGWAGHVAAVYTRFALTRRGFAVRFGLTTVVVAAIAVASSPWWLLLVPVLLGLLALGLYAGTRRNAIRALPPGSVATVELVPDGFISRNAGGSRETRYADVRELEVRGDVALVRTGRAWRLMARTLFPDDAIERMRQRA